MYYIFSPLCVCVALVIQHAVRMRHVIYNIFPHYLINGTIFKTKLLNTKCAFWFPLQLLSGTFLVLRRTERDVIIYIYIYILVFIYSNRHSCQILMKFEFSRQFLEKYSNTSFHENPFLGSRVVPCGQTDGRTDRPDMTHLRVAFRNFANAPKVAILMSATRRL